MNWRGISGIYAGLAVVLGGAWLWMRYSSIWALMAIGVGFVLAAVSLMHIVRVRQGPRPAKAAKAPRVWRTKAAPVADNEADEIARARMAAIAGRTTGRVASTEAEPVQQAVDVEPPVAFVAADLVETAMDEPEDNLSSGDVPVADVDPNLENKPIIEVPDPVVSEEIVPDVVQPEPEPIAAVEYSEGDRAFDAAASEPRETLSADVEPDEPEAPVVALDELPGFPWTARFIGLWTREVRYACPDDLRGAVGHWQRWADGQEAGTPLVEEAADEFNAMLSAWRECGAGVPGLASDDAAAVQLAEEAAEDAALAALLPGVLRVRAVQIA